MLTFAILWLILWRVWIINVRWFLLLFRRNCKTLIVWLITNRPWEALNKLLSRARPLTAQVFAASHFRTPVKFPFSQDEHCMQHVLSSFKCRTRCVNAVLSPSFELPMPFWPPWFRKICHKGYLAMCIKLGAYLVQAKNSVGSDHPLELSKSAKA